MTMATLLLPTTTTTLLLLLLLLHIFSFCLNQPFYLLTPGLPKANTCDFWSRFLKV